MSEEDADGEGGLLLTPPPAAARVRPPDPPRGGGGPAPPPLGLWALAVLVFYNVSGGPFGIEPAVRAGGNLYAILGFVAGPLVWSVPEALVTAELGSAFPDASGGVAWVEEAFGDTAACLAGLLSWVGGATDNAVYPALFLDYAASVVGGAGGGLVGWTRFLTLSAVTVALALLNYAGLEIVGRSSIVLCVVAMTPFVVFTFAGLPMVVPSRWLQTPGGPEDDGDPPLFDDDFQTSSGPLPLPSLGGVLWRPYLNNLFWNLNSFDSVASFAGETACFESTYPKGIFIGLVMTIAFYLVPLMVAVGATDYSQEEWVDGFLGRVAVDVGGKWLGAWVIFAAGISNLGLFEAELSADSFQLMGMAERGFLPKVFGKRSRHGTPSVGILFSTCFIVVFCTADFESLLQLLNSVYSIALLLEYAAFVKLRLCRKDLPRPYRIPIPDWAASLLVLPPVMGILVILAISSWYVYMFIIGSVVVGVGLFKLTEVCKRREWLEFEIVDRHLVYDMAQMNEVSTAECPVSPRDTGGGNGMADRVSLRECAYDIQDEVKSMA